MTRFTIGVDLGTTGTKVVLLDPDGRILAQQSAPADLYSPQPGFAEADARQWLDNVSSIIPALLAAANVSPTSVVAIATTGMVPAVLFLDAAGAPLRRAILQNDARATAEISQLALRLEGLDVTEITGSALTQQSVAPTLMWVREHEPEVWAATAHVVGSYDWLLMALGARPHVERNWALESGLFRVAGDRFEAVYEHARLDRDVVPGPATAGTVVGALSVKAARMIGLPTGVSLVVGGADHVLSAFAAGAPVPRHASRARPLATQRVHGDQRQPDPVVPGADRRR